jgi:hypothetical protein
VPLSEERNLRKFEKKTIEIVWIKFEGKFEKELRETVKTVGLG